ncbi:hypothetical protein KR018_011967, partial [Drosophila ironensis]
MNGMADEVMAIMSTLRLLHITHTSKFSALFRLIGNRVMELHHLIQGKFGDAYFYSDDSLLVLFLFKMLLAVHHIVAQYTPHNKDLIIVRFHTLNVILFEILYSAYVLYQLLLLGWQRTLIGFLESQIEVLKEKRGLASKCCRQIIATFEIYAQMAQVHVLASSAWLKVSSMLFISVYYTAHESTYTSYCLFSLSEISVRNRTKLVVFKKLGTCLHPLVAVLLLGIATDRLKDLETRLRDKVFLLELL